jgi:LacI family transcriptional regulator
MPARTLEDIAQALNISRRTVARVLRKDRFVSDAMRERVLRLLEKEKFIPNVQASNLAAGRVNVLGIVLPTSIAQTIDDYVLKLIKGAFLAAEERRHHLMFFSFPKLEADAVRALVRSRTVGGMLFSFVGVEDFAGLRALRRDGVPVVMINGIAPGLDSFDCDNVLGGAVATRHLLAVGRRRIAFLHGDSNWISSRDRFAGYRRALDEAGVPLREAMVARGFYSVDGAEQAVPGILPAKPDAIFCANDLMALGALSALKRAGRRVPDDVAVMGFDDIPMVGLPMLETTVSSMSQPVQAIAWAATNRLMDLMEGRPPKAPVQTLFPPTLVVRQSTIGVGR